MRCRSQQHATDPSVQGLRVCIVDGSWSSAAADKAQRLPPGNVCLCMAQSKERLLKQVDSLRDMARRATRLSDVIDHGSDKEMLLRYAKELEDSAVRLEKEAVEAKTSPSRAVERG